MPTHAMLDLETLGVRHDAQILTIGGVKFDPLHPGKDPHSDFYFRLDVDDQAARGRTVTPETLDWWAKQEDHIIEEALGDHDRTPVAKMLPALKKWIVGVDKVWAQGIVFDVGMLEHLCRDYDHPIPWQFYQVEDSRTLINRMPFDPRKDFTFDAHNALEDARIQAKAVQITFKHFGFVK